MDVLPSLSAWIRLQDWQKKLSLLVPEQHRLTEKLRNLNLNKISRGWQTDITPVTEVSALRLLTFWPFPLPFFSGDPDLSERECDGERWELPQAEGSARHSGEGDHRQTGPDGAVQQGAEGQWFATDVFRRRRRESDSLHYSGSASHRFFYFWWKPDWLYSLFPVFTLSQSNQLAHSKMNAWTQKWYYFHLTLCKKANRPLNASYKKRKWKWPLRFELFYEKNKSLVQS